MHIVWSPERSSLAMSLKFLERYGNHAFPKVLTILAFLHAGSMEDPSWLCFLRMDWDSMRIRSGCRAGLPSQETTKGDVLDRSVQGVIMSKAGLLSRYAFSSEGRLFM